MRNFAVAAAFTLTLGFVAATAWRAEAVPLTVAPVDVAKPVQPAACGGPAAIAGRAATGFAGPMAIIAGAPPAEPFRGRSGAARVYRGGRRGAQTAALLPLVKRQRS